MKINKASVVMYVYYQLSMSIDMKRWVLSSLNHCQPTATDGCCQNNIIIIIVVIEIIIFKK